MGGLFEHSKFNGDISKWNVSNVKDMSQMFRDSLFNGNISKWNIFWTKNMRGMFYSSKFNQDISNWNVSYVEDMAYMFFNAKNFNQNLSLWTPFSLDIDDDCFTNYLGSVPYWAYCHERVERNEEILAYREKVLMKENLSNTLAIKSERKSVRKI